MKRTQTPQILAMISSIVLTIGFGITGEIGYLCLAFVMLFIGVCIMLDYDEYLEWKKEMEQNQEAFDMLVKDDELP